MKNNAKICLLALCLALGSSLPGSIVHADNSVSYSVNTFKDVANEVRQMRNQYKERQNYLRARKNLGEIDNTLQAIDDALANNVKIAADIRARKQEMEKRQQENRDWFAGSEGMLAARTPRLRELRAHAERMEYLEQEISACEAAIAERLRLAENYKQQIAALKSGIIGTSDRYAYGSASFKDQEEAVLKALKQIRYEESRLDEANAIKNKLLRGKSAADLVDDESIAKHNDAVWAGINVWQEKADRVNEDLQPYFALRRELYLIKDRVREAEELRQELENLDAWQKEVDAYNDELRQEGRAAEAGKLDVKRYLAHERYGRYLSRGMEYYSWKGDDGYDGHQLYLPVHYFQEHGYKEYGLSVAYVNTAADFGADSESLNGITNLFLHYGIRNANDRYSVKYILDSDLPIGDSKIGNNILSDDLVILTRLNEGINIRPRIEITRQDGDENLWLAALSYNIKGSYHYSKERPGASVDPGDTLWGRLRWTHAEKKYQLRLGMEAFLHGKTSVTGDEDTADYKEGREMHYKVTYNRRLSKASELMGYFWLRVNAATTYDDDNVDSGSDVRYYGLEYKYSLDESRAWYVRNNNMLSTGDYYDPMSDAGISGRDKHTLGIGYEINLREKGIFTVEANYYRMREKRPRREYRGTEFAVWYSQPI